MLFWKHPCPCGILNRLHILTCSYSSSTGQVKLFTYFQRHKEFTLRDSRHYSRYVQGHIHPDTRKAPPWRTVFFGTDEYALAHLKALNENRLTGDFKVIDSLEVVTPKSKCLVEEYAIDHGLRLHRWPIPIMHGKFDMGIIVSFGHLIPQGVISMFPYGILNVHPSLLPRWRGASPIIHTILNGDPYTGISIMEIRPVHYDIGPLLMQARYPVPARATTFQLRDFLADRGSSMLLQALRNLPTLEILEHEQAPIGVTYAHKLSVCNARVNWEEQTAEDIDRQNRALGQIYNLRSMWKQLHVRLVDMVSPDEMKDANILDDLKALYPEDQLCPLPGLPHYHKVQKVLCVRCKGGWVGFRAVVIKTSMSAQSFHNGYLSKPENRGIVFQGRANQLDKYTLRTRVAQMRLRQAIRTSA